MGAQASTQLNHAEKFASAVANHAPHQNDEVTETIITGAKHVRIRLDYMEEGGDGAILSSRKVRRDGARECHTDRN